MAFRTLPLPWLPCLLCAVAAVVSVGAAAADPTKGFTAVSLSESNFVLQKPYDLPSDARYRFRGGVRQLWVLSSDKPHTVPIRATPSQEPRSE